MKKTMLWGALFSLMSAQIQAEGVDNNTISQVQTIATAAEQSQQQSGAELNLAQNEKAQQPQSAPPAAAPTPPASQTAPSQPAPAVTQQPAPAAPIDCDYKIPASTKVVDPLIVTNWSEKATIQAFQFDTNNMDAQLQKLQSCFTEQGWVGFKNALQKSGNIDAIKSQKLNVAPKLDGKAQITESKDNQWKITLPLEVVYQNDKEKVTQTLNVSLTVGRKPNGDLGILQLIAMPRTAAVNPNSQNTGTTTPSSAQQPASGQQPPK